MASPRVVSGTEAALAHPDGEVGPVHDAFTRLLHRLEPEPNALWSEVWRQIGRRRGVLVLDDSTLDKPYARHMDLVTRHWSGKHRNVVSGINLLTLLWSDGERLIPVHYRIYDKARDGKTKTTISTIYWTGPIRAASSPSACSSTTGIPAWRTSRRCAPPAGPG